MKKTILLTRPRVSSERWKTLLAKSGFDSVVEPLLVIEPTDAPRPPGKYQAVVFTSAYAPEALEAMKPHIVDLLMLPCFCVGASTGEAARDCGFTTIFCGTSDSAELAQMIVAEIQDRNTPLLHITGENVDPKAGAILTKNSFTLTSWILYRAVAADDFSEATRAQFAAGQIHIIPVFSSRSARILVSIIEKNRLTQACHQITALGLSQAVADVLKLLPWRRLHVAATPKADDVIASLQPELSMTQTEKNPSSSSLPLPPAPPHGIKKKKGFLWGLLGIFLLAASGSVALVKCPFLVAAAIPPSTLPTGALEKRVENIEARLNTLTEIPGIPSPPSADDTTLADTVKILQNQVAQLQGLGTQDQHVERQWVTSAFAFWDLREAAMQGRPFSSQLSVLRKASDDHTIAEQTAKLDPYASSPPPTLAQLKEELLALETSLSAPTTQEGTLTFRGSIQTALGALISVHPLHDPQLADLEKALDSGTAQDAYDAYRFLPDNVQHQLTPWSEKLEARRTVDNTLLTLGALFTAPSLSVPVPPEQTP